MRIHRGIAVAVAAGALTIGLSACGGGTSTTAAPVHTATNPLTSLAVAACKPTFGITPAPSIPRPPHTVTVSLPATLTARMGAYSDGELTMLGPKGWHCGGIIAADGGRSLFIAPPGIQDPSADTAAAAVTGEVPGNPGTDATTVCQYFPEAAQGLHLGNLCGPPPASETVTRTSAYVVWFSDPPGVSGAGDPSGGPYQAQGVLTFTPPAASVNPDGGATKATCTVPSPDQNLCKAILTDFLQRTPS